MNESSKIRGLVLAGGESKRMGKDKASLVYYNKPQLYYMADMLEKLGIPTAISINKNQSHLIHQNYNFIEDSYENCGPLAGILTAFDSEPNATWLVIACDYPLIRPFDIQHLIFESKQAANSIAYYAHNLYFPSLAIYTPDMIEHFKDALGIKEYKMQNILSKGKVTKLKPLNLVRFVSADTPEIALSIQNELKK